MEDLQEKKRKSTEDKLLAGDGPNDHGDDASIGGKRLKATGNLAIEEEIDEEEECMLAQAMANIDVPPAADVALEETVPTTPIVVPNPRRGKPKAGAAATGTSAPQTPMPPMPLAGCGARSVAPSVQLAPQPQDLPSSSHRDDDAAVGKRTTWAGCSTVQSLDLLNAKCPLFKPPKKCNTQKWEAELAKIKGPLGQLELLLGCGVGKVKDQELKGALTALKKAMGKNGSSNMEELITLISGLVDEWQKLKPGLYVAFPTHWVQAWVSASVNKLLGEMNADGLTDDTALKLRSALFLHKSLNDEDVLPAKDNAFGKLADFFFFCPGCFDCASDLKALGFWNLLEDMTQVCSVLTWNLFQLNFLNAEYRIPYTTFASAMTYCAQVDKLQCKWVAEVLIKSFSCKAASSFVIAEAALRIFLPPNFVAIDECLNQNLAALLQLVHSMLHKVNLATMLEKCSAIVCPDVLRTVSPPLVKMGSFTQFKRLQQTCHTEVAAASLDAETAGVAAEIQTKTTTMKADFDNCEMNLSQDVADEAFKTADVTRLMNSLKSFHDQVMTLPQTSSSQHAAVRAEATAVIEQGQSLLQNTVGKLTGILIKQLSDPGVILSDKSAFDSFFDMDCLLEFVVSVTKDKRPEREDERFAFHPGKSFNPVTNWFPFSLRTRLIFAADIASVKPFFCNLQRIEDSVLKDDLDKAMALGHCLVSLQKEVTDPGKGTDCGDSFTTFKTAFDSLATAAGKRNAVNMLAGKPEIIESNMVQLKLLQACGLALSSVANDDTVANELASLDTEVSNLNVKKNSVLNKEDAMLKQSVTDKVTTVKTLLPRWPIIPSLSSASLTKVKDELKMINPAELGAAYAALRDVVQSVNQMPQQQQGTVFERQLMDEMQEALQSATIILATQSGWAGEQVFSER
ncbi:unnamed protein product [Durusdinium trenchii]|uniref:Uncharacterized protein n=1 Tax=Durusdinium trenchii TaxID=1381693 RepID=A0ABP0HIY3_9DINO